MNSTISDRIDALVFRFEHAVTASDIIRWLTNFDEKEWDYALKILENTIYYSSDRILDTLTNYIAKILKSAKGKCVWILPSGEIGKSGHVMAYYAKKIIGNLHLSDKAIKLVSKDDLNNIPDDRIYLVLLDDFSGSGKSIAKFYQEQVQSNTRVSSFTFQN